MSSQIKINDLLKYACAIRIFSLHIHLKWNQTNPVMRHIHIFETCIDCQNMSMNMLRKSMSWKKLNFCIKFNWYKCKRVTNQCYTNACVRKLIAKWEAAHHLTAAIVPLAVPLRKLSDLSRENLFGKAVERGKNTINII